MFIQMYIKEGQRKCYECSQYFILDYNGSNGKSHQYSTICPNDHNYGSWARLEPNEEYNIPHKISVSRVRRRIEEKLRKDPEFFKKVLQIF